MDLEAVRLTLTATLGIILPPGLVAIYLLYTLKKNPALCGLSICALGFNPTWIKTALLTDTHDGFFWIRTLKSSEFWTEILTGLAFASLLTIVPIVFVTTFILYDTIMKSSKTTQYLKLLSLFGLGALAALSMAPLSLPVALIPGLSVLFVFTYTAKSVKGAAFFGFIFSLGYFGVSLSWIGNALLVEGNQYKWAWPLAVSGLPLMLAPFTALACAAFKAICKNKTAITSFFAFVILIALADFARGNLFTGFPWNLYGYTWGEILPIAQLAALHDIYILNFITIFWATLPALLYIYRKNIGVILAVICVGAGSFTASYLFGQAQINNFSNNQDDGTSQFIVVQPNIKQSEKWKPEKQAENFLTLIELSKYKPAQAGTEAKSHYIVWPETSIGQGILDAPWAKEIIKSTLQEYPSDAYLITGALRYEKSEKSYYNSILTFNQDAEIIDTYNKSHLVPFGEYMPLSNIIDIAPIVGFTGFARGEKPTPQTTPSALKISPLICYEIIFPHYAKNSNAIINVTNDAWYGDSAGPRQHLMQARFRAIESRTPVIRAANTGISAVISPTGNLMQTLELDKQGTILQNYAFPIAK